MGSINQLWFNKWQDNTSWLLNDSILQSIDTNSWKVNIILWTFFWDEWKWRIVDNEAKKYSVVARCQWGWNAWHTLVIGGKKIVLHTLPSWIVTPETTNIIWGWVVIDPAWVLDELNELEEYWVNDTTNRLKISDQAHFILPTHRLLDMANEQAKWKWKIGSTGKWIWPAYSDRTSREWLYVYLLHDENEFKEAYNSLKAKHMILLKAMNFDVTQSKIDNMSLEEYERKWFDWIKRLKKHEIINVSNYANSILDAWTDILAEWAQWTLLDINHWTYPFVTSSDTWTTWVLTGLWISHKRLWDIMWVTKAYSTRVWGWPFPTALKWELWVLLWDKWQEFWATTKRRRDTWWLDLVALKYSAEINWLTSLALTKLDILSNDYPKIQVATWYKYANWVELKHFPSCAKEMQLIEPVYESLEWWNEDISKAREFDELPKTAQIFIKRIEEIVQTPIKLIWVWPDREEIIIK